MAEKKWVAGWGASTSVISQNHAEYFKDQTFRYSFFPTISGDKVRLHFSNRYGDECATLTKASIALSAGSHRIVSGTSVPVTFNGGEASLTLEPGKEDYVSDEIEFSAEAGKEFTVSLYFEGLTKLMTGHSNNGPYIKKYYARGELTEAAEIPLEVLGENGPYVFLNTIDFLTEENCNAIVAFGDSITAQPWPDCLAHRLYDLGIRDRAVIRRGIGGNRILRDYRWRMKKHWGEAGIKRFERDVTNVAGADRVFVLHGINDMLHPAVDSKVCPMSELPTADEIIGGLKKYVEIAHSHGMKIYIATVLPCMRIIGVPGDRGDMRLKVNAWIRTNKEADGYIDFEEAVKKPGTIHEMVEEYDSGDHLHPSLAGAHKLADSIPEKLLK